MNTIFSIIGFVRNNKKVIRNMFLIVLFVGMVCLMAIEKQQKIKFKTKLTATELLLTTTEHRLTEKQQLNDSLYKRVQELEKLDAISLTIKFDITNKAVMGKIQTGDINQFAEAIQTITRKEALNLLKQQNNNNNND